MHTLLAKNTFAFKQSYRLSSIMWSVVLPGGLWNGMFTAIVRFTVTAESVAYLLAASVTRILPGTSHLALEMFFWKFVQPQAI